VSIRWVFKSLLHAVWRVARALLAWFVIQITLTYVALNALIFLYFTQPRRVFQEQINPRTYSWHTPLDYEAVRLPARGGDVRIAAWFIPAPGASRAVVLAHGKDGSRTDEFFGRYVEFAAALHKAGYAVLMIDLRAHGQSEGQYTSFGRDERRDVLGAVDWLVGRGFAKRQIGLHGVSLGGASVLGAMADDAEIGAVVSDSAFGDLSAAAAFQWTRLTRTPPALMYPGFALARRQTGVDIADARPVADIARIRARPVLLIHGGADALVPIEQHSMLSAANSAASSWVVADADHGGIYRHNPVAYLERVLDFYAKALGA
jgi:dipeptidyl aminopeptidase/acylaminoacyl peptidase